MRFSSFPHALVLLALTLLLAGFLFLESAGTALADNGTLFAHLRFPNLDILDNGGWDGRAVWSHTLSGAPSGSQITSVDIEYNIDHPYVGDLQVWLTTERPRGTWHDLLLRDRTGGAADDIHETKSGRTEWNGLDPNGTWYLMVADYASSDVGEIDSWKIWVH